MKLMMFIDNKTGAPIYVNLERVECFQNGKKYSTTEIILPSEKKVVSGSLEDLIAKISEVER